MHIYIYSVYLHMFSHSCKNLPIHRLAFDNPIFWYFSEFTQSMAARVSIAFACPIFWRDF